jgi:hypothetical protein
MFKFTILIAVLVCIGFAGSVYGQSTGQRTQDLVAALDKTKYKKKEKRNISIEIYIDVKNEAAVRSNPSDYSGVYEDNGYRLDLSVSPNGAATGSGFDSIGPDGGRMNFTLKDARVDGALLTAMKAFDGGRAEPFEAVFVNRTVSGGTNPNNITDRETAFGIGFIQSSGTWNSRIFLGLKR